MAALAVLTQVPAAQADPLPNNPAAAGVTSAAPASEPTLEPTDEAGVLAVVNLGLSTSQAMKVQCWLRDFWGYTGAIDGQLGTNSWKAFQRNLQTFWGYTGPIDGIAGSGTQAAFKRFANAQVC